MEDDVDLDALGRQFRDARASIATNRRKQARVEVALGRLRRRLPEDHPDVARARDAVVKAHSDVRWCQAVTIAVGEVYKGRTFDQIVATQRERPRLPEDLLRRIEEEYG